MTTAIPADAGEKLQYAVHRFNDNTIRFALHYPGLIQADILQDAVLALVRGADVLHSAFRADHRRAWWQPMPITEKDCFLHIHTPADPIPPILEQALHPLQAADAAKLRCVLAEGQNECALALSVSHLCADGRDSLYLLKKLCQAYQLRLHQGHCDSLRIKNGSRRAAQVYQGMDSKAKRRILKDPRTGVKEVFPFPSAEAGKRMVFTRCIPSQEMARCHEKAREMGASINDLLLTACYYAYVETAEKDPGSPVSILSMMDLRRHCPGGDSAGLCNLTGSLPTLLQDGLAPTFPQTLSLIAAQTRRCKADPCAGLYGMPLLHAASRYLPMDLLLKAARCVYSSMGIGITNVGSMTGEELALQGLIPSACWFGGPVKQKPGLQICTVSLDGACSLSIWCHAAPEDEPLLNRLLDRMAGHIRAFAGE